MDRRPITDRGERAGTGQHRADRDQQNRLQAVTTPTAPARIRNLHQLAQQSDPLPGGQASAGSPDSLTAATSGDGEDDDAGTSLLAGDRGTRHPQTTTRSVTA